jgi:hypothetical protein
MVAMPFASIDIETKNAAAPAPIPAALATRIGNMNAVATIPVCWRPRKKITGNGGFSSAAYSRSGGRMVTRIVAV